METPVFGGSQLLFEPQAVCQAPPQPQAPAEVNYASRGRPEVPMEPQQPRAYTQPTPAPSEVSNPREFYADVVEAGAPAAVAQQAGQFLGFDPFTREPLYSEPETNQITRGGAPPTEKQIEAARWASHNQLGAPADGIMHSDREAMSGDVQAARGNQAPHPFPHERVGNERTFDQTRAPAHVRDILNAPHEVAREPVAPPPPMSRPAQPAPAKVASISNYVAEITPPPPPPAPKIASISGYLAELAPPVPAPAAEAKVLKDIRVSATETHHHVMVDANFDADLASVSSAAAKVRPATKELKLTIIKIIQVSADTFHDPASPPMVDGATKRMIVVIRSVPRVEVPANG